jgi:sugar phosphate isomerase/epimerase
MLGEIEVMSEIVIVSSAFGAEAVRQRGHAAWIAAAARAGAAGFEVRRELCDASQVSADALAVLGAAIRAQGLWSVYSVPDALYDEAGDLNEPALVAALSQADALGARFVKLQLGAFRGRADGPALARASARARARLVVENGQLDVGGRIDQFVLLFDALAREGVPDVLGMTFDIGNWIWPGESPREAARALASHVEYVHCKAVHGVGARRFPVAPEQGDALMRDVFDLLPRQAPRGIEFPLDENRLDDDAKRRVAWLAAA